MITVLTTKGIESLDLHQGGEAGHLQEEDVKVHLHLAPDHKIKAVLASLEEGADRILMKIEGDINNQGGIIMKEMIEIIQGEGMIDIRVKGEIETGIETDKFQVNIFVAKLLA